MNYKLLWYSFSDLEITKLKGYEELKITQAFSRQICMIISVLTSFKGANKRKKTIRNVEILFTVEMQN